MCTSQRYNTATVTSASLEQTDNSALQGSLAETRQRIAELTKIANEDPARAGATLLELTDEVRDFMEQTNLVPVLNEMLSQWIGCPDSFSGQQRKAAHDTVREILRLSTFLTNLRSINDCFLMEFESLSGHE